MPEPAVALVRGRAAAGAAVVAVLLVGAAAVSKSAGLALATRSPDTALRVDPSNSIALAQAALRDVQVDQSAAARERVRGMAARAIRRDAANATALSALGLATADGVAANKMFLASEALSRRSLLTQLALIEQSVARNDVAAALTHYDIALRTSPGSASILFPVLVEAVSDAELLPAIAKKLAARPAWGETYLMQLAQVGTALPNAASLFVGLARMGHAPNASATATLYQRLIEAQRYDDAWRMYAAARPAASRTGVRNGDFRTANDNQTPFDWVPTTESPVTVNFESGAAGGGRLSFSSPLGEGGTAARQLLLLGAGTHVIQATAYGIKAAADARPYFKLDCAAGGVELGRVPLTAAERSNGLVNFRVAVPATCKAQWLSLVLQPSSSSESIEGAIGGVSVR